MALYFTWTALCDELDQLEIEFRKFAAATGSLPSGPFTLVEECLLEGLVSRLWQAWGNFWRTCISQSCMGTADGAGGAIAALPQAFSEAHVFGAAIKANNPKNKPPYWGSQNTIIRYEPTWGDVDSLSRIIPRLSPVNQPQLIAAISSAYTIAKDIQTIRNAAAHTNIQSIAEVSKIRTRYVSFTTTHPIQSLFWTETSSRDFLVLYVIEEFRNASLAAIS